MLLYRLLFLCYNEITNRKHCYAEDSAHEKSTAYIGRNNMDYRNFIAGAMAFALAACAAGCGEKKNSDTKSESGTVPVEETTEELVPPTPTEATDPNAITFDDGVFDFASVKEDDKYCAKGELSVAELMGNKMLKFADDNSVPLEGKVQKIGINVVKLLGNEGAAKVRRIEFDMYAEATADHLKTDDAEGVRAPGWIGGGGGTMTAQDKWYDFQEFSGGEYNFEASGAVHAQFKFLLADSGQCWSEEMEDANFLIMRWGIANESDMYIDNIVFYDEDGNSIPVSNENETEPAAQDSGSVEEKLEDAAKLMDETGAGDELRAEYEKLADEVKNSEDFEAASAKMDEFMEKVRQAKLAEIDKQTAEAIKAAQQQADEINSQAQEAIEEASRQIAEKQQNQ